MKTAVIYLMGIPGIDKKEPVKTVQYTDVKTLKLHLKQLQEGYCEGRYDKPKITEYKHPQNGKLIIDCTSDADWHYVALLGYKLKPETNKPVETLN